MIWNIAALACVAVSMFWVVLQMRNEAILAKREPDGYTVAERVCSKFLRCCIAAGWWGALFLSVLRVWEMIQG